MLDGERIENLLWENGLDFEFVLVDGVNTLGIFSGGSQLCVETVWAEEDSNGWFFDKNDITFRTGPLSNLELYGTSAADSEEELIEEILSIRENIL